LTLLLLLLKQGHWWDQRQGKAASPSLLPSSHSVPGRTPLTSPGREPRGSIQKLLEEKKVGRILGFFETLSSSKTAETEPKVPPPCDRLISLQSQPQSQPFSPVVDDRMASYLQMAPEDPVGSDPDTGK
jgi:hypothetical protein